MRCSFAAVLVASCSVCSVLGVACAAPDVPEQSTEADVSSGSHLSQDLVCAAVAAAEANSEGEGLTSIPQSKLRGDALHDFKAFQRNTLPDYPSVAYELPVKLGTKTYTFIMVSENNDGGGAVGLYRTDGSVVATDEYSESESNPWSSPADKCPDAE
jgi:hypothetical protein